MYIADVGFQTRVFLYSVGFGTLLGIVYDVFRIISLAATGKRRAVFVRDFLFLVVSTFLTFLFLLVVNNGRLRFYIFAAVIIGFFAYYFTLGSIVIKAGSVMIKALKKIFGLLGAAISAPLRGIINLIKKINCKLSNIFINILKKIKN